MERESMLGLNDRITFSIRKEKRTEKEREREDGGCWRDKWCVSVCECVCVCVCVPGGLGASLPNNPMVN
jgi:hypothetical protein